MCSLSELQVQEIAENDNPWIVFVETTDPEKPQEKLPYFEKDSMYAFYMYTVVCALFSRLILYNRLSGHYTDVARLRVRHSDMLSRG